MAFVSYLFIIWTAYLFEKPMNIPPIAYDYVYLDTKNHILKPIGI